MMSLKEYAIDVAKSIEEIISLCKRLNISIRDENDMLSEDDIIVLDNELSSLDNNIEKEDISIEEEILDDDELEKDLTKNYNEKATEDELKKMIESITSNNQTGDLFDDLKTIHSPNLKEEVEEEMDKSLFTSSLGFTSKDFEDLNDIKHEVKKNGILVKILLFVFLVIIVTSCIFLSYSFFNK